MNTLVWILITNNIYTESFCVPIVVLGVLHTLTYLITKQPYVMVIIIRLSEKQSNLPFKLQISHQ